MREGEALGHIHGFLRYRLKIAKARRARRTPSNGIETAKQLEKSHPDSLAVGFVFNAIFSSN